MLHPTFVRERTDKRVDAGDVGMGQLTSRLSLDFGPVPSVGAAATAQVLARGVWTKETKGLVAIRKYVLIQTNKAGRDFPPLVLFATGFSPCRAEPLHTSLRTAHTRDAADRQIAEWIEENIKKGWIPAGTVAAGTAPDGETAPAAEAAPAEPVPKKRVRKPKA